MVTRGKDRSAVGSDIGDKSGMSDWREAERFSVSIEVVLGEDTLDVFRVVDQRLSVCVMEKGLTSSISVTGRSEAMLIC